MFGRKSHGGDWRDAMRYRNNASGGWSWEEMRARGRAYAEARMKKNARPCSRVTLHERLKNIIIDDVGIVSTEFKVLESKPLVRKSVVVPLDIVKQLYQGKSDEVASEDMIDYLITEHGFVHLGWVGVTDGSYEVKGLVVTGYFVE